MNITNANSDFQDFSKCDYSLHWSWSNFFRHIMVCNSILALKPGSKILEIGAADSPIENLLKTNFKKSFVFTKTDVNEKYKDQMEIFDIEKEGLHRYNTSTFDCVILTEVIEHFEPKNAIRVLLEIRRVLKYNCIFLLTTPTPDKKIEDRVWPEDHDFEYSLKELLLLLQDIFFIKKIAPWSMSKEKYNEIFYGKTKSLIVPDGLLRAINSLKASPFDSRQIFIEAIKT